MALVSGRCWEKWVVKAAVPHSAHAARFFHVEQMDAAWQWLGDESNFRLERSNTMSDRDIVSSAMAEELDGRVEQAGGDIAAVRHELEDQLHALEANEKPEDRVQIALLLSEMIYLDEKAKEMQQSVEEKHVGLMDRMRHIFSSEA